MALQLSWHALCLHISRSPYIIPPLSRSATMTSPCDEHFSAVTTGVLHQPQPRRLKRRMLEEADHLTTLSKRPRYDRISPWLETLASPVKHPKLVRSRSCIPPQSASTAARSRSCSAPPIAMSSSAYRLPLTPAHSRSFQSSRGSQYESKSQYSRSYAESSSSEAASVAPKVGDPLYRQFNLDNNGVYLREQYTELPEELRPIVEEIYAKQSFPASVLLEPDPELSALENGTTECDVEAYFQQKVFMKSYGDVVRSDKAMMFKDFVPRNPLSNLRITQPVPDMAYGYFSHSFTEPQQIQLGNMGREATANSQGLLYPFLTIELKADGPHGGGSLWVAANQCLGGSATCSNLASNLKKRLSSCEDPSIIKRSSAAFSIRTNGYMCIVDVAWEEADKKFFSQKVGEYYLQDPEHFVQFQRHFRNIIDWGSNERLSWIREDLDKLLKADRLEASPPSKISSSAAAYQQN